MIDQPSGNTPTIVTVSVGNTRVRAGLSTRLANRPEIEQSASFPIAEAAARIADLAVGASVVAMATVNEPASTLLTDTLANVGAPPVLRVNREIPVPLKHTLTDATTLGQDRALNALAAFRRVEQACVVIDAGTAITVDFVDGEGIFHGGVIVPGCQMMLDALHTRTSALPEVSFESLPDPLEPFGRDTPGAMLLGSASAARGLVRHMAERYAEFYGAFAQIIATGGDAETLFRNDDLVEVIVPDLTLIGIAEAFYDESEDPS